MTTCKRCNGSGLSAYQPGPVTLVCPRCNMSGHEPGSAPLAAFDSVGHDHGHATANSPTANPVGGMVEYRRDGAYWRRYPDGTETGPHAESVAGPGAHEGAAGVFVSDDAARLPGDFLRDLRGQAASFGRDGWVTFGAFRPKADLGIMKLNAVAAGPAPTEPESKGETMADHCECSTTNQVVMTEDGVHKWTGDTLSVPFDWATGPRLPVAAHPDMLNNRRPGCGKPRPDGFESTTLTGSVVDAASDYTHGQLEAEQRQREAIRAELDRPVAKKGGAR